MKGYNRNNLGSLEGMMSVSGLSQGPIGLVVSSFFLCILSLGHLIKRVPETGWGGRQLEGLPLRDLRNWWPFVMIYVDLTTLVIHLETIKHIAGLAVYRTFNT